MTHGSTDPLARVRREFARGLPERLDKIRSALTVLREGFDALHAEQFHVVSHALVGMAATFDAHEMAEQAQVLAQLGRRWRKEGPPTHAELDEALERVALLEGTVTAFLRHTDGGGE